MITELLGLFTSSGVGAIVGILGSYLTKIEDRKLQKETNAYQLEVMRLRLEESRSEHAHELEMADKQMERAELEGAIGIGEAEVDAFKESIKSQQIRSGTKWVDAVRGIMRPFITIYLLGIATYLTLKVSLIVGGIDSMSQDFINALFQDIIGKIMFLTTTAILWWFGARPSQQSRIKK